MKRDTLFIIAFAVMVYFLFGFIAQIFYNYFGDSALKVMDAPSYFDTAEGFFKHFRADSMRTLGFPFLLGLPFLFTSSWHVVQQWTFCLNFIAWCLTAVFIYRTICLFASEKIAMAFAIIFILCLGNLEYVYMLLSENVYTCVLAGTIYMFSAYVVKKNIEFLSWALVLFSFSILIRPTLWPLYPPICLVCIWIFFRSIKKYSKRKVYRYFSVAAIGVLLIVCQLGMMKKSYGTYTLSYNGDKTMYVYLGAFVESLETGTSLEQIKASRSADIGKYMSCSRYDELDSMCSSNMHSQIKNSPQTVFKALRTDIIVNAIMPGQFETSNVKNWPFFALQKKICYFLTGWQNILFTFFIAISGIIAFLFKRKLNREAFIVILLNCAIGCVLIVISGISFWQYNRFSVVYTPEVLINMSLLISAVSNKKTVQRA